MAAHRIAQSRNYPPVAGDPTPTDLGSDRGNEELLRVAAGCSGASAAAAAAPRKLHGVATNDAPPSQSLQEKGTRCDDGRGLQQR